MPPTDTERTWLETGERTGQRYALQIPREAMRGNTGVHLGRMAGSSIDFKDFREYQPGDDLRHIDWHVFARTDKTIVKLYREEVSPHLDLLIDGSRSMDLPGSPKRQAVWTVAALLAGAARNTQCSHAAWLSGHGYDSVQGGTGRPSLWMQPEFAADISPGAAHTVRPPRCRRFGMRVLISDLLWPEPPLTALRLLSQDAAALTVVQILARSDVDPPTEGNIRLNDVETGELMDVFVDASARQRYRRALTDLQEQWSRACRQTGAQLATLVAEDIVDDLDLTPLERANLVGAV